MKIFTLAQLAVSLGLTPAQAQYLCLKTGVRPILQAGTRGTRVYDQEAADALARAAAEVYTHRMNPMRPQCVAL